MIDKEALQFLQAQFLSASNPTIRSEEDGIPYVIIPDGVMAQSLEKFLAAPTRFRGEFMTRRISDFTNYIKGNQGGPETGVFVDPETIEATALFGLGSHSSPGWIEHQAVLKPKPLPPFAALLASSHAPGNVPFTQLEFLDFMADWKSYLSYYDDAGAEISYPVAVKAVRSITVQAKQQADSTVGNLSSSRASLESIDVMARADCLLPESFVFSCKPYDEFRTRHFECTLRAIVKDGAPPRLTYRIVGLDAIRLEVADEFVEKLKDSFQAFGVGGLAESAFIGTFTRAR